MKLFYCYSHRDEDQRDELEISLALLKREGKIESWHDRRITAGRDWEGEIDRHLREADIILLLVSRYFVSSDYIWDVELKLALQLHEEGRARVIPILLKPCEWQSAPFAKIQGLPKDAKPVTTWPNIDEAWTNVASGIRRAIEDMKTH
jgi:hypothetical protein